MKKGNHLSESEFLKPLFSFFAAAFLAAAMIANDVALVTTGVNPK